MGCGRSHPRGRGAGGQRQAQGHQHRPAASRRPLSRRTRPGVNRLHFGSFPALLPWCGDRHQYHHTPLPPVLPLQSPRAFPSPAAGRRARWCLLLCKFEEGKQRTLGVPRQPRRDVLGGSVPFAPGSARSRAQLGRQQQRRRRQCQPRLPAVDAGTRPCSGERMSKPRGLPE